MHSGTITKGIGGFYYVDTGKSIVECKAQGHFRNKNISPCVGDKVNIIIADDGKGIVSDIHERKNIFVRPPVSNLDALIIVASLKNPEPDLSFIDKMLVISKANNVDAIVCFNKSDLGNDTAKKLSDIYKNAGYQTVVTSTIEDSGIEFIREYIKDKTVAFCGFSGVGKSSLLNCVIGSDIMQTGEVSERLKRGKHTTRHVELIKYNGGYIVDTPGFSMLDFPEELSKEELKDYFPEFTEFSLECRFADCAHNGTPKVCAVCAAAENGKISDTRYKNYLEFYKTLSQRKDWKK